MPSTSRHTQSPLTIPPTQDFQTLTPLSNLRNYKRLSNGVRLLSLVFVSLLYLSGSGWAQTIPFPSTPILDNFNRPDQGPPASSNWINALSSLYPCHGGILVKNNKAAGPNITCSHSSTWKTQFPQDQEAYYSFGNTPGTGAGMGPAVRLKVPNDFQSDQYLVFFHQENFGNNYSIANLWKRKNGVWTKPASATINRDLVAGDQMGLRAVGNKIEVFLNGQRIIAYTDPNPLMGPGYANLYVGDAPGHTADNFGAGAVGSSQGGSSPEMSSPSPNSTLSGDTVTFSWDSNGTSVDQWWLEVGSTQNGNNIFNSGSLSSGTRSQSVSGLPTNGSPVWVELWWQNSSGWHSTDYQYTAASTTPPPSSSGPRITSPVSGTQLPGSSVTFTWTPDNTSVQIWWLQVGTSQNTSNLYDSGGLSSNTLSRTVSSLPTNGSPIWAKLWWKAANGSWKSKNFQYTAANGGSTGGGDPAITSPTPGSQISGSTKTFTWKANGQNVFKWWLRIGTTKGAKNIHDSGELSSGTLSKTVSGLPTNGSAIWVRLWYQTTNGWLFKDFQYNQ